MDSNPQQQIIFPLDPASVQILVNALTPYFGAALVSQIVAGVGISISPVTGVGAVTVTNAGVQSLLVGAGVTLSGSTGNITITVSDATISTSDITTNNVSTSKHGFAPKAPNDSTKFLNGVGAWSVPSGAGGTHKFGVATRSNTAANGSQTIAHGLGATPSYVRLSYFLGGSSAMLVAGASIFDGSTTAIAYANTIPGSGATGASAGGSTDAINTADNGGNGQDATIAVDGTNITLTWSKSGTPIAGTIQILWEVW